MRMCVVLQRYILNLTTSLMDELQVKDDEGPVNE